MRYIERRNVKSARRKNVVPQEKHVERHLSKDLQDQSRVISVRSLKKCAHSNIYAVITGSDVVITQLTTLINKC